MKELKDWTLQEIKDHCTSCGNCGDCKNKDIKEFCYMAVTKSTRPYNWELEKCDV